MSDAFEAVFADASKVTGTVRHRRPDGSVRTGKLSVGPVGIAEEDFAAAAVHGVTFSEKAGDAERSRVRTAKGITGAAARSAVLCILGFTPDPDVPDGVRRRGKSVPSANGEPAAK